MQKSRILLIDDSEDIHVLVKKTLVDIADVASAHTSAEGLKLFEESPYDIVIIDLMLGNDNGMDLLKEFKSNPSHISRFFILTGKDSTSDEAIGHTMGVDEYIKKPVDREVLKAIVRKNLKLLKDEKGNELIIPPFHLVVDQFRVYLGEKKEEVQLTIKEFKILVKLVSHPDKPFSREDLFNQLWSNESESTYRTIDMHVSTLRKKLGAHGDTIKTVHQVGYKFSPK